VASHPTRLLPSNLKNSFVFLPDSKRFPTQTTELATIFLYSVGLGVPLRSSIWAGPYLRHCTVSITGQSVWDLWWKKWHANRISYGYFGLCLVLLFHQCSLWLNSFIQSFIHSFITDANIYNISVW